jgi:hypothetical protein
MGLIALLSTVTAVPATDQPPAAITNRDWEAVWTRVLGRYVDDRGRIDFAGLEADRSDLDRVVAFVAAVDPESAPERFAGRQSRLAYYVNAYNALAMHGVLEAGVPESFGGLRKFSFFYLRTFTIGGRSISLYDFENNVIRPLGEERVHFALNCMVVSCPRLPRHAFAADALERQLDAAARAFIAEERNVRVDPTAREVWLSGIFEFYPRDFLARAPNLIAYVNRYRGVVIPADFRIRFLDYDWTVNDRARVGAGGR